MENNFIVVSESENRLLATLFKEGEKVSQSVFDTISEELFVTPTNKKAWKLGKRYYDAHGCLDVSKLIGAYSEDNNPSEMKDIVDDGDVWKALYDVSAIRLDNISVSRAVRALKPFYKVGRGVRFKREDLINYLTADRREAQV